MQLTFQKCSLAIARCVTTPLDLKILNSLLYSHFHILDSLIYSHSQIVILILTFSTVCFIDILTICSLLNWLYAMTEGLYSKDVADFWEFWESCSKLSSVCKILSKFSTVCEIHDSLNYNYCIQQI